MSVGELVRQGSGRVANSSLPARVLTGAMVITVAVAAFYSGLHVGSGDRAKVVLPLLAAIAVAVGVLAMTRFAGFVLLILGARASLDLFKLSGSAAGNTQTNTVARGLDPSSLLALLFLLAAFLWLAAQYRERGHLRASPMRYAFIAFTAAAFCSTLGSAWLGPSALEFTRILSVLIMFVVLEELATSREMIEKILVATYASAVFPLGYTLFTILVGDPAAEVKGSYTRLSGPFTQSTTFGRYLAFLVVFGVAILPYLRRRWHRRAMMVILPLSTIFLLLTLTRGVVLAAAAGVVIVGLAQRRYRMLLGIGAVGVLALLLVPGLMTRLLELGAVQDVGGAPTGNTLDWRLRYWTEILPLANSNPITGIGLNVTQYLTDQAKQPHNDFIRAYIEMGVVGLVTYTIWVGSLLALGLKAMARTRPQSFDRGVAAGFLGCAVAFTAQSLGANAMSNVVTLWYFIAFAAVASAVAHHGIRGMGPTEPPSESAADHRGASAEREPADVD